MGALLSIWSSPDDRRDGERRWVDLVTAVCIMFCYVRLCVTSKLSFTLYSLMSITNERLRETKRKQAVEAAGVVVVGVTFALRLFSKQWPKSYWAWNGGASDFIETFLLENISGKSSHYSSSIVFFLTVNLRRKDQVTFSYKSTFKKENAEMFLIVIIKKHLMDLESWVLH